MEGKEIFTGNNKFAKQFNGFIFY